MAATEGKRQIDSDGKRFMDTDGKVRADSADNEACCCEGGCLVCPDDVSITIADMVLCSCVEFSPGFYFKQITNFNGTYTGFTRSGGDGIVTDCGFSKDIGPQEMRIYTSSDCTGDYDVNLDTGAQLVINHYIADDKWFGFLHLNNDAIIDLVLAFVGLSDPDVGFTTPIVEIINDPDCGATVDADPRLNGWIMVAHEGSMEIEFICA